MLLTAGRLQGASPSGTSVFPCIHKLIQISHTLGVNPDGSSGTPCPIVVTMGPSNSVPMGECGHLVNPLQNINSRGTVKLLEVPPPVQ